MQYNRNNAKVSVFFNASLRNEIKSINNIWFEKAEVAFFDKKKIRGEIVKRQRFNITYFHNNRQHMKRKDFKHLEQTNSVNNPPASSAMNVYFLTIANCLFSFHWISSLLIPSEKIHTRASFIFEEFYCSIHDHSKSILIHL